MKSWCPVDRRDFLQWTMLGVAGLAGCRPSRESPTDTADESPQSRRPVKLKLLVLDDAPLAAAIQEQWGLRGEGTLEVENGTSADILKAARAPAADAILFPSGQLGELAERDWLLPFTDDVLRDPNIGWNSMFDLLRLRDALWNRTTYALPLGSPPFFLLYRGDLWDQAGLAAPESWADYQAALEQLGTANPGVPAASAEPLAAGWAGHVLLARAAAYALHRGYLAVWFDLETMDPRIASAPFERALTELAAACPDAAALEWTPDAVLERFLGGEAVSAITWPTRNIARATASDAAAAAGLRIAELPGAREAYHRERSEWSPRAAEGEGTRVTLLGAAGRLAAVLKRSSHRSAAANVLVWLGGPQWSGQIAAASRATTLARPTPSEELDAWVPSAFPDAARQQYLEVLTSALQRPSVLLAPRLPGRDDYMAALDRAVAAVVRGEQAPAEALATAAGEWRVITERLGTDKQKAAYRRSLGL